PSFSRRDVQRVHDGGGSSEGWSATKQARGAAGVTRVAKEATASGRREGGPGGDVETASRADCRRARILALLRVRTRQGACPDDAGPRRSRELLTSTGRDSSDSRGAAGTGVPTAHVVCDGGRQRRGTGEGRDESARHAAPRVDADRATGRIRVGIVACLASPCLAGRRRR